MIAARFITLVFYAIRWIYWRLEETKADKEKPKQKRNSWYFHFSRTIWFGIHFLVVAQVVGLQVLPIPSVSWWFVWLGVGIVAAGTLIAIIARHQLATNWANGYEYQVKKNQELVTSGIYSMVRHPIYLGLGLTYIGGEMVAGSYLWISYAIGLLVAFYFQGKREEVLFEEHFGEAYRAYKKRTKMLIPFIL